MQSGDHGHPGPPCKPSRMTLLADPSLKPFLTLRGSMTGQLLQTVVRAFLR